MTLKKANILVVDDDLDVLTAVKLLLKTEVAEIITEKNPENIHQQLQQHAINLVLLDMNFNSSIHTGNEGLYWLRKIKEWKPNLGVIMITAYGDIDLAVKSLKEGAHDFIVKPWHNEKLIDTIQNFLYKKEDAKPAKSKALPSTTLLGNTEPMQDLFYKVNKVAPTEANILILGENGTGKDLMAKVIHERSLRADKPFIKVDVGALSDSLFESELFGHKKGAFTDAREDRTGLFVEAQGGTLFLDEIGNISLQQQAKLLTVLQNRQVTPLGANKPIEIDIRLICATNIPLHELANENRFRKDLIYRINTVEIHMPPLRARGDDIMLLAQHFAQHYAAKYLRQTPNFDHTAIEKLNNYHYPGNVRELQYTIERAVIMADDLLLKDNDLLFSSLENKTKTPGPENQIPLSTLEKNTILQVIEKNKGNITHAAKELGLTRTALYRRLNKYDI